jgi:DNA transposition AAA+ family ATPase
MGVGVDRRDDLIERSDATLVRCWKCMKTGRTLAEESLDRVEQTAARITKTREMIQRSDETIDLMQFLRGTLPYCG